MLDTRQVIAVHYSWWAAPKRLAIRTRKGPRHETIDIYRFGTLRELIERVARLLADIDPEFLDRLDAIDDREFTNHTQRKRRYFSKHRDTLYLQSPSLEKYSVQVNGYWLATNVGAREVGALIKAMAEAAHAPLSGLSSAKL